MKKIIVPVDFSELSENALKTAAFLAKKNDAQVIVVHMLELSKALFTQTDSYSQEEGIFYLKLAEKKFDEFLDKEYLKNISVKPLVRHHKVISELNDVAKEENADLIIMGSHGSSGIQEVFVGSNTERVVRNSDIPVLVIKGNPINYDFKTAVFGCNFSENDLKPYLKAKEFLNNIDCKLKLLHVNTPYANFKSSKELREIVSKFLKDADEQMSFQNTKDLQQVVSTFLESSDTKSKKSDELQEVVSKFLKDASEDPKNQHDEVVYTSDHYVETGILDYVNTNNCDLIVMATHGRTGLSHFFEGSVSEDVVNHSNIPVLTFKIV